MENIPQRPYLSSYYRNVLTWLEKRVYFPRINPSFYSALQIFFSFWTLYLDTIPQRILVIFIILMLDWLDGATARRHHLESKSGYLVDLTVDRISETILLFRSLPLFILSLINTILSFRSVKTNFHTIIPLRFIYLLILIGQYIKWIPQL